MAPEIGIGLVGYGAIGRLHALCYRMLPLAYPDLPVAARLVAVATASAASAERARRELGDVTATTDLAELLDRPDIAVVDCCAPTGDHAPPGGRDSSTSGSPVTRPEASVTRPVTVTF